MLSLIPSGHKAMVIPVRQPSQAALDMAHNILHAEQPSLIKLFRDNDDFKMLSKDQQVNILAQIAPDLITQINTMMNRWVATNPKTDFKNPATFNAMQTAFTQELCTPEMIARTLGDFPEIKEARRAPYLERAKQYATALISDITTSVNANDYVQRLEPAQQQEAVSHYINAIIPAIADTIAAWQSSDSFKNAPETTRLLLLHTQFCAFDVIEKELLKLPAIVEIKHKEYVDAAANYLEYLSTPPADLWIPRLDADTAPGTYDFMCNRR
jgi:hypothetical protein